MPTTLATDNFNRANGGLGGNWTTVTGMGAPQIVSNAVNTATVGTDAVARYSAVTWPNDQYSQIKVITTANLNRGVGVIVRCATGAATFYSLYCKNLGATATLTLIEVTAGSAANLATTTATAVASGDTIRLEASGTSLRSYVNGVNVAALNVTDASITSGQAGFQVFVDDSGTTNAVGDDWEGGDMADATGQPAAKRMGGVPHAHCVGGAHGHSGVQVWCKAASAFLDEIRTGRKLARLLGA